MVELTPLDKTVAGQELIQMGMKKGELIGQIIIAQLLLKLPLNSKEELEVKTDKQLKAILKKLEAQI